MVCQIILCYRARNGVRYVRGGGWVDLLKHGYW